MIKKFYDFISEDVNTDTMKKNISVYNRYKGRVSSMVKKDDIEKSNEDFEKLISSLREDEKGATDLLRTLFSAEKLKVRIEKLNDDKKDIDEQIRMRQAELRDIQSKIK